MTKCARKAMGSGMAVLILAMLVACGGQSGGRNGPADASAPYPAAFKEIVQKHMARHFAQDQVLRSIVIRPPSAGWLHYEGRRLPGHVGQVDFSLRDERAQTFRRVTYCYFLHDNRVLAFEEQEDAAWCAGENNHEEGQE